MKSHTLTRFRRRAHPVGRAITALALGLMATSVVSLVVGNENRVFAAGTLAGVVTFADSSGPITAGGSADFTMKLPQGAACQGSGTSNYRWETFLVSASVDVSALSFTSGPEPVSGAFVSAVYSSDGEAVSTKFPSASPLGLISGMPQLSLPNTSTPLPAGDYKIGVACQLSGAIQEYWSTAITVTGSDFAWAVNATSASTTTTSAAPTTTTSVGSSTTTSVGAGSTTTTSGASTTSTTSTSTTSTTLFGSGAITTYPSYTIVATGGSPIPMLVWAVLLLALGRIVILLGRPMRVLPPRQ